MPNLAEISLDNNPVEKNANILQVLKQKFSSLQYFNL